MMIMLIKKEYTRAYLIFLIDFYSQIIKNISRLRWKSLTHMLKKVYMRLFDIISNQLFFQIIKNISRLAERIKLNFVLYNK
jgi:hypothetical protein